MKYLKTVVLAAKCTWGTQVFVVGPECYRLVAIAPTLWESLSVMSAQVGPLKLQVSSSG